MAATVHRHRRPPRSTGTAAGWLLAHPVGRARDRRFGSGSTRCGGSIGRYTRLMVGTDPPRRSTIASPGAGATARPAYSPYRLGIVCLGGRSRCRTPCRPRRPGPTRPS